MQEKAPYSAWRAPWEEWAWDSVGGVWFSRVHRSMGSRTRATRSRPRSSQGRADENAGFLHPLVRDRTLTRSCNTRAARLGEASRRAMARAARRDRRPASRHAGPPRGGARRGGRAGRARLRREEPEQRDAAAQVQQHGDRLGAGAQEGEQQEGLAPARVAQAAHQRALRARGAGRGHARSLAT